MSDKNLDEPCGMEDIIAANFWKIHSAILSIPYVVFSIVLSVIGYYFISFFVFDQPSFFTRICALKRAGTLSLLFSVLLPVLEWCV